MFLKIASVFSINREDWVSLNKVDEISACFLCNFPKGLVLKSVNEYADITLIILGNISLYWNKSKLLWLQYLSPLSYFYL